MLAKDYMANRKSQCTSQTITNDNKKLSKSLIIGNLSITLFINNLQPFSKISNQLYTMFISTSKLFSKIILLFQITMVFQTLVL